MKKAKELLYVPILLTYTYITILCFLTPTNADLCFKKNGIEVMTITEEGKVITDNITDNTAQTPNNYALTVKRIGEDALWMEESGIFVSRDYSPETPIEYTGCVFTNHEGVDVAEVTSEKDFITIDSEYQLEALVAYFDGISVFKKTDVNDDINMDYVSITSAHGVEGKVNKTQETDKYFYYIKDHLGSTRAVLNTDGSKISEVVAYNSYGNIVEKEASPDPAREKFTGKELDQEGAGDGIALYNFEARMYDSEVGMFISPDPVEEFHNLYSYTGGNPINLTDPTGLSTWVTKNEDGTYKVVGGNLEDDDLGVYVVTKNDDGTFTRTGETIGQSMTMYSFFNDEKEQHGWRGTIDLNSTEAADFLQDKIIGEDVGVWEYVNNAKKGKPLDLKRLPLKPGHEDFENREYHYRGSVFITKEDGTKVLVSARDIGNYSAGWVAGKSGINWALHRLVADGLETKESMDLGLWSLRNLWTTECTSTKLVQKVGYKAGLNEYYRRDRMNNYFRNRKQKFK